MPRKCRKSARVTEERKSWEESSTQNTSNQSTDKSTPSCSRNSGTYYLPTSVPQCNFIIVAFDGSVCNGPCPATFYFRLLTAISPLVHRFSSFASARIAKEGQPHWADQDLIADVLEAEFILQSGRDTEGYIIIDNIDSKHWQTDK